jgi:hypothetical protein
LEIAEDGVIDRELPVEDLLQVCLDVTETEVEALEGLQLVGNASGEGADRDVSDIAQEVLDTDLFGLLGLNNRWCVDKGLGCGGSVLFRGLLAGSRGAGTPRPHTSLISSTAKYASVGTPASFGWTSIMTSSGLGV